MKDDERNTAVRPGGFRLAVLDGFAGDDLIPIEDFPIYCLLATEVARMAASEAGPGLCAFVDSRTAAQIDAADAMRTAARHTVVFGALPEGWASAERVIASPERSCLAPESDQGETSEVLLVAISPIFSMALIGEQGPSGFTGGWTPKRSVVRRVAELLLDACGTQGIRKGDPLGTDAQVTRAGLPDGLTLGPEAVQPEDVTLACATRVMALWTRQLALRQRDIAMDKDDLFSVLNILKAVSAKRRAHDILYVFVEQIAHAVPMQRCSVVRVWGGDNVGHVLASHEDESIADLTIDLLKYPEIRRAMETRQKVIINDTRRDPLTRPFMNDLAQSGIASIVVIPVVLFDQNVGSFLLRAARTQGSFALREISFCEIVAEAAANALERAHLFESIQRVNERLEYLADTDGLTGLYNHRYFRERLESEFERARRYRLPLSCMIMDIDGFKKINDSFGHLQGDCILRSIAAITLQAVRKSDIVARYGGEEFVVIMPQTGFEGAKAHAERVCREIAQSSHEGLPEGQHVTVSIGVAVFDPETMLDCEALIRAADTALYDAKREGKNRVVVGQP